MSKKLVIPKTVFQDMDIYNSSYQIRFRIVSQDRNRISAWTPIYSADPEVVFFRGDPDVAGTLKLEKHSGYVNVTWDSVSIYKDIDGDLSYIAELPHYDLWIKWAGNSGANPSDWHYKERIASTSLNINIPTNYIDSNGNTQPAPKQLHVEIYRPGRPILRYEQTKTITQNAATFDTTSDVINFFQGHRCATGTPIVYTSATPVSPLVSTTTYYVRSINYRKIALYPTKADSEADTNRIDLTGTPSGTATLTGYPFLMYSGSITTL